ncbi:hypothetical protein CK203_041610 [Vitis vinifera]|uniref:DUF4283 domain-containing protein n=1 Tax=Vitis vinifera TaxID=29760 RepID=A0A438I7Q1_VITVI|nr:hypothetical protein CK203_041610 [Vitis vinifera]
MEEREREKTVERERASSEGDPVQRCASDGVRDFSSLDARTSRWKRSFEVESKTFEIELERKKGKTQIFIEERKRGVSSWIKMGPVSLGFVVEGLALCIEDTRTGRWVRNWRERGRLFSLLRDENKGGSFIRLGVEDGEKKRFNIFIPKGKEGKGGWSVMLQILQALIGTTKRKEYQKEEKVMVAPCEGSSYAQVVGSVHCWIVGAEVGKGGGLEEMGKPNGSIVGAEGNLGLAKLERGKVLLEFERRDEAEKAIKMGEIWVGKTMLWLEKWNPRTGCLLEGEERSEAWVRIVGLPISLWNREILRKIGEKCGGFLAMDSQTERLEELQWARILVKISGEELPSRLDIGDEGVFYSLTLWWEVRPVMRRMSAERKDSNSGDAAGEVEGEAVTRVGKRVMELVEGVRPETHLQSADGTRGQIDGPGSVRALSRGPNGLGLGDKEGLHGRLCHAGPHRGLGLDVGPDGFVSQKAGPISSGPLSSGRHLDLKGFGFMEAVKSDAEGVLFWEYEGRRRQAEMEACLVEKSRTDCALIEEASRYECAPIPCGLMASELASSPLFFFGRSPLGDFCDNSGVDRVAHLRDTPLCILFPLGPSEEENEGRLWEGSSVCKESSGKVLRLVHSEPNVGKGWEEENWEESELAKFSKFLGFSIEGMEKEILEFMIKIRKRREKVHNKNMLEKSRFERELKRLECSINYEKGKKQKGGMIVGGGQFMVDK